MKKILFLLLFCFLEGCISLSDLPQNINNTASDYKKIDDSKIAIMLLSNDQEFCASKGQLEFLKNVLSKYYNIDENQKIKVKIRSVSNNDESIYMLNLALTSVTYSIIPLYESVKYNIEVELISDKSVKIIRGWFVDEGLISVWVLPFVFERNFYNVIKMKIEQTLYKMSNTAGEVIPTDLKSEFKSSPLCTNSIHDFFIWQRWK